MHRRLPLALVVIAVAAVSCPATLLAQKATAGAAAFDDGRRQFAAGDYAGALPRFRQALEATGSPNAALYVARCLNETGDVVGAHAMMSRALRDASQRGAGAKYAATREAATRELAAIEKRVARVRVALGEAPPDATVRVNGNPVEVGALGEPLVVAPGKIRVVASAPGRVDASREVDVAAGAVETLQLALPRAAPEPEKARPAAAPRGDGGPAPLRIAGFVAAGLGTAGLAVFVVAGVMASNDFATVEEACAGHCTDPAYDDVISRGRTLDTVANVGLAVAIAGLAGGGAMIVLGGSKPEAHEHAAVLVVRGGAPLLAYRRAF